MNPITSITQGCDFTLRIRAKRVATRGYVNVSFVEIADIHVNLVNLPATKTPIAYTIDSEGRLLLDIDGESLDCNSYGIEILGYYNNGNWRHQLAPAFNIVRTSSQDNYALTESDERTIDLIIVIGETYLTTKGFNQAMEEHDQDIHAHNDLRNTISNMIGQISDLVTEVANAEDGIGQMQQQVEAAMPTKVSELTNDSGYQNEQQVQQKVDAAKITSADISIDGGTGTPSGSAGVSGNKLVIALHNIKGEKGNDGNDGQTGPAGPQGATSVYDQTTQDFLTTLETTKGQSQTKTMTQKAITDAINETMDEVVVNISDYVNKLRINQSSDVLETANDHTTYYLPVNIGEYLHITATHSEAKPFRYGFTTIVPASGVAVQGVVRLSAASVDESVMASANGYLVLHHPTGIFANMKVTVKKSASPNEINEKASQKTLLDVLDIAGGSMVSVAETATYSNSVNRYGGLATKMSDTYRTYEYAVEGEKVYSISGRLYSGTNCPGYVFLDSSNKVLSFGVSAGSSAADFSTRVIAPKGAVKLYVNGTASSHGLYEVTATQKTIYPKMVYEHLSNGSSAMGFFSINMAYNRAVSTIRFIKVNGGFSVLLPEDRAMRVFEFDGNFQCLRYNDYDVTANVEQSINVGKDASYIKIMLMEELASGSDDISIVRMRLKGSFPDNWDTFNVSQFGEGRQLVIARARLTDPTCFNNDSSNPQDTGEYFADCGLITRETYEEYGSYLWDYGRIFLPSTYDNLGEPTRLIIYCHGAAVNYNTGNASSAEVRDLDPTYWLAEGYAILDIEGNPFNNDDEHIHSPQALECYVAAYKWAIEHYNLKRDGVFLGGRSLGGGMTLAMIRKECPIPVIAACPNVPSLETVFHTTPERKTFWAKCCGIHTPSGFTFQDGRTVADRQVFMDNDNWDRWIKQVPLVSVITDLPVTAEEKEDFADHIWGTVEGGTTTDEVCFSYFMTKHAEVKCPVKIFGCYEDASIDPNMGPKALYRMLINSGQIAEFRLFHDSRYPSSPTGPDAHHYDTQDPAQRQDGIVTRYGTVVDDVPTVYIEMLKFWRRFEQE